MTTYKHIVQVHPVENGLPNLYKVNCEREFDTVDAAYKWLDNYNDDRQDDGRCVREFKAVYYGRVNDATGELE